MTATLNIRIDRGGMIRGAKLNKPFFLLMDGNNLGEINWGDHRSFRIPAGKHILTLKYRPFEMWWALDILAAEGETVDVDSLMDMKKGKFTLYNRSNGMTSDDCPASPNPEQMQLITKKTKSTLIRRFVVGIVGSICAGLGGFLAYLLYLGSGFGDRLVLFIMVFIGTFLGGLVGLGIAAIFKK